MGPPKSGKGTHDPDTLPEQPPAWVNTLRQNIVSDLKKDLKQMVDEVKKELTTKIDEMNATIKTMSHEYQTLASQYDTLKQSVHNHQSHTDYMRSKWTEQRDRLIKLENYSMRENLIFSGLPEYPNETEESIRKVLTDLFSDDLKLDVSDLNIISCHRLGALDKTSDRPRDIIARFSRHSSKKAVLYAAKKLAGRDNPIYINEQFPKEIARNRAVLRPIIKMARKMDIKASLVQDTLIIEGKRYDVNTLHDIPLDTSNIGTKTTESKVLFGGMLSEYSNLYTRDALFQLDETTYSSTEQYYQRKKAEHAGNLAAETEIMLQTDPLEMKRIGELIRVPKSWEKLAPKVMMKCTLAKFSQNASLKETILSTGDLTITEYTQNKPWGIGRLLNDPEADNRKNWTGKNLMGRTLEQVRKQL